MTNQEAIKRIKEHIAIHKYRESHAIHIVEALEMAISALQEQDLQPNLQQTCNLASNDCISRQAAIDAHYEYCNKHPDAGFPVWSLKILEDLPSAQPEIIRCKDCIFHGLCRTSTRWAVAPKDDWFCADAERRTDEYTD